MTLQKRKAEKEKAKVDDKNFQEFWKQKNSELVMRFFGFLELIKLFRNKEILLIRKLKKKEAKIFLNTIRKKL